MEVSPLLMRSSSYSTSLSSDTTSSIPGSSSSDPKMMKIAIAGTNGFAQFLAHHIQTGTPYQFMLLSRTDNPELKRWKSWQVVKTDYTPGPDLDYLLTGVDIVISTIAGPEQIALINAAANASIGRFIPSEFRESPYLRSDDDPTDNFRKAALTRLEELETQGRLTYTVFSCGLFYERLGPGGLARCHIDTNHTLGEEGDLLVNLRDRLIKIPFSESNVVQISIISSWDAARYVIAALSLRVWPRQFVFRGQQIDVVDLIDICQRVTGRQFQLELCDPTSILASLGHARTIQHRRLEVQSFQMLAISQGRYDFLATNLDQMVNVNCESFEQWLTKLLTSGDFISDRD